MTVETSSQVIAARCAIALMSIVPAVGFLAGILTQPGPARDPIAVSSACVLFLVLPGTAVVAAILFRWLPRGRPLLRRLVLSGCFFLAAIACVADFWFIGIGAGLKSTSLVVYLVPLTVLVLLTASQWPGSETLTQPLPAQAQS